jgi:hypothetical protein
MGYGWKAWLTGLDQLLALKWASVGHLYLYRIFK